MVSVGSLRFINLIFSFSMYSISQPYFLFFFWGAAFLDKKIKLVNEDDETYHKTDNNSGYLYVSGSKVKS
jgi:hypothetical protein